MRILFVDNLLMENINGIYTFDLQPHLGLISLVAVAENGGHNGILYDPKFELLKERLPLDESLYTEMATAILRHSPDVVGMTSLGCNFICTIKVAAHLKSMNPDLPILLGGPHASILHNEIIRDFSQFDVVARNEAEEILLPLLNALRDRNFSNLPGITYRRGSQTVVNPGSPIISDLDMLPRAAYHHYPIKELNLSVLRVEAGRGCPFDCTFCSTASFFGRKYRLKSAPNLANELDYLNAQYNISHFALTHDLFTVSRSKVLEFCDAINDRGYTWTCSARMDCVDPEMLERMYEAGCRSIYYGVETGSQRMQKIVAKRLDLSLFTPILDATQRTGMTATASFITGYVQEQQSDQDETLDMIGSCFTRYPSGLTIQLHLLTPEPGTQLHTEFAHQLAYDGHISDFNFPTLESDDGHIMSEHPEIFMNHHYYPSIVPRKRHVFVTSIHRVIYQLGFIYLGHLLSYYHGRLSNFYGRVFDWTEQNDNQYLPSSKMICDFLRDEWGEDHYLYSLTRYMVAAIDLRNAAGENVQLDSPDHSNAGNPSFCPQVGDYYVLRPSVTILRKIQNCSAILRHIAELRTLNGSNTSALFTQMGNYLLMIDDPAKNSVRNFELNDALADLLEFFSVARSYEQYLRELGDHLTNLDMPRDLLIDLVNRGVICVVYPSQNAKNANMREFEGTQLCTAKTKRVQVRMGRHGVKKS